METNREIVREFETMYYKMGKSRKKCRVCGKLIEDGSVVVGKMVKVERYYPVKGLMCFTTWFFVHKDCEG